MFGLDNIHKDLRYIKAHQFIDEFDPKGDVNYKWVYEYAKEILTNAKEVIVGIDKKAQNVITYLGTGSGILGVGFTLLAFQRIDFQLLSAVSAALGVIFIILAMMFAFGVLMPHQQTLGGSIRDALKTADYYVNEEQALGYYTTGIAESVSILRIIADHKSGRLRWSYRCFIIGSILIVTSLLSICYFLLESPLSP